MAENNKKISFKTMVATGALILRDDKKDGNQAPSLPTRAGPASNPVSALSRSDAPIKEV